MGFVVASAIVLPWTLTFMIGKALPFRLMLLNTLHVLHRQRSSTTCSEAHPV